LRGSWPRKRCPCWWPPRSKGGRASRIIVPRGTLGLGHQWSLPNARPLGSLSGLFGYRHDTPQQLPESLQSSYAGNYWVRPDATRTGSLVCQWQTRDPPVAFCDTPAVATTQVYSRGPCGALCSISGRKKDSVFSSLDRKWLWFWSVCDPFIAARFRPVRAFYRLLYALPYFSTIRNPASSLMFSTGQPWCFCLRRACARLPVFGSPATSSQGVVATVKSWWQVCAASTGATRSGAALAWPPQSWVADLCLQPGRAGQVSARGPVRPSHGGGHGQIQFRAGAVVCVLFRRGRGPPGADPQRSLGGRAAKWAALALGCLLVVDLGRANLPWIITWNYEQKYATNPVIDTLRNKPYEDGFRRARVDWPGSARAA